MPINYSGYGDSSLVKVDEWYCPENGVSAEWIANRVVELVEHFIVVDSIYMSEDVYCQFMKDLNSELCYNTTPPMPANHQLVAINTPDGSLDVKLVPGFTNFCHIGTNATYDDLVRVQVDEAFERIVLKDCESQ